MQWLRVAIVWQNTVKLGEIGQPGLRQGSCRLPTGGVSKVSSKSKGLADPGLPWQPLSPRQGRWASLFFSTLAFLFAFGADKCLLTYFADLSGPG